MTLSAAPGRAPVHRDTALLIPTVLPAWATGHCCRVYVLHSGPVEDDHSAPTKQRATASRHYCQSSSVARLVSSTANKVTGWERSSSQDLQRSSISSVRHITHTDRPPNAPVSAMSTTSSKAEGVEKPHCHSACTCGAGEKSIVSCIEKQVSSAFASQ